ncbi:MAG: response regulator [Candidatus Dactylopiibacterium carminicum]|uniref:Response regulator n=1 Tax=Candidatus Dactylopiibacterium carminicum TaxID=857335 RepID=A0A272ESZ3_9RHOO|nr:tetratricopeptide repeat protein [Candidatus Dactylopiibacterium carminicum]KAF7598964.1 response regulator [Candidatus Dactylopiibacterium carminicum]PAS92850.1 MAG: response regulator [Candidatus Dactylopiibacterium carminicum]PAS96354.1 MAG: response regulator [Candidatus Dactylopiibacterium carminicum]
MPLFTLFLMITGESQYEKVVSAAELAPNDYILKPFSSDKLLNRLSRALEKRDAFMPTYRLIETGNTLEAIESCRQGEIDEPQYLVDFLRLRAELHIGIGEAEEAQIVYQKVLETPAVPWARLGLARTLFMQKRLAEAEALLSGLLQENALYLDAYDWLARVRESAGKAMAAKEALEDAVRVSPHTVRRLRRLGEVATEVGDMATATRVLSTVVNKSKYSDFRDPEDHVSLVRAQLGMGDAAGASNTLRDLERNMEGLPKTALCKAVSSAMVATQLGDLAKAQEALDEALRYNDPQLGTSMGLQKQLARICIENRQDDKAAEVIMDVMRHAADDAAVEEIKNMLTDLGRGELGNELAEQVRTQVRDIMTEGAQLAQSGDYPGAVRQMLQAAEKLPGNTAVLFNAALALLKHIEHLGWNDQFASSARQFIERVRAQDAGNKNLAQLVSYYHALLRRYGIKPGRVR